MNLPPGNTLKTGLDTSAVDFAALLGELIRMKFNGYIAVTINGVAGIEEGTMIFDDGKSVASAYEYLAYRKLILGKDAFIRVLNASAAKNGVMDVVELTNEQVHLVLAFTEAAIYVPSDVELKNVPKKFSTEFELPLRNQQIPLSRQELLRKYRLADSAIRSKDTEAKPVPPETGQMDLLKQLADETRAQQELRERIKTV